MKNIFFNVITAIMFIFFLSLSFIGLFFGITSKQENTEWRKLAEFPKINSKIKINEFPKKFDLFFNDNFGFRNILLRADATIAFELFKKSPVAAVIRTDKDWYFHNEARFTAPDYKLYYHHIIFSEHQLAAIGDFFLAEKKWLDQKNIPYLFVIIPDKEVIYPEYYPYPNFINANIQLSQILSSLDKRGIQTLFLGPQMIKAKKSIDIPIYTRQDAHWNSLGAFFGYQAVINRLKEYFPGIESLQLSDFNIAINSVELKKGYDLNRLKSLIKNPNESIEPIIDFKVKDNVADKINKIGKVIIYGDSYFLGDPYKDYIGGSMYYLKYNFKDMIYAHDSLWGVEKSKIEKEQPDIVIREIIQRNLYKSFGPSGADIHY